MKKLCPNAKVRRTILTTKTHTVGKCELFCRICHGWGYTKPCLRCSGAGMIPPRDICPDCHGNGVVPA